MYIKFLEMYTISCTEIATIPSKSNRMRNLGQTQVKCMTNVSEDIMHEKSCPGFFNNASKCFILKRLHKL